VFLIYGATGYTGRLCAEHAVEQGLRPVLAGRNRETVRQLAESLSLEWRAFGLSPTAAELGGISAVLHAAGPFSATSAPMASACLGAGVHYCDITGEIDVFEALASRDAEARAAGVMLLPGAGFDVVPSDCLAAHVAARLPGATRLRLSIGGLTKASRGTVKTMLESVGIGVRVRRHGKILAGDPRSRASADFGAGERKTLGVPWGDVSTAWRSTGIGNIEVFFEASRDIEIMARLPGVARSLLTYDPVQRFLQRQVERSLPPGPSKEDRARGRAVVVAEAWDDTGGHASSMLATPEPYELTARTAVEIARMAGDGEALPGYQTPSTAYGADLIMRFDGVLRTNL
jgi:short subunit dehydrogenase-like uncharacterized protein